VRVVTVRLLTSVKGYIAIEVAPTRVGRVEAERLAPEGDDDPRLLNLVRARVVPAGVRMPEWIHFRIRCTVRDCGLHPVHGSLRVETPRVYATPARDTVTPVA
jgi:hypothetical protein